MFRTQLYNPLVDPERQEYYKQAHLIEPSSHSSTSSFSDGYYLKLDQSKYLTKLWNIYKSKSWHTYKSISCRLLMSSYTIYLNIDLFYSLNQKIALFNLAYLFLILADCLIVLYVRKGLEDRWCSLSILFFICANTSSFFLLEVFYNSFLTLSIFNPEMSKHVDLEYSLSNTSVLTRVQLSNGLEIDSTNHWSDLIDKETYFNILSKHEAIFCIVLILSRLFLPQATLTWSAISTMCEFSFNTLFDVFSTMSLCRDSKLNLPQDIIIACYLISNSSLISIALNLFHDHSDTAESNLKISLMRKLTDNFYFRLIIQILFADLPFLIIRLLIITQFQTLIRPDIYYLIAKQFIIIACKFMFMLYIYFN